MKTTLVALALLIPALAFGQKQDVFDFGKPRYDPALAGAIGRFHIKDSIASARRDSVFATTGHFPKVVWADSVLIDNKYIAKRD